jgi:uncharacterized damage-inducible protein DinB
MRFDLDEAADVLSRTPAVLDSLLRDLPAAWVSGNEGGETWSPFDVLGHLIHGERTDWVPRARVILQSGESEPFEPFDRFAQFEASEGKSLGELLGAFAALRADSIRALRGLNLTAEDLSRTGTHPELGTVTLGQLLATWVVHDLDHIAQITRTMARQYGEAVGPWEEYLSVLKWRRG